MNKIYFIPLLLILIGFFPALMFSYTPPDVPFTQTPPIIDGKLDDPAWISALKYSDFKSFKPDYGHVASQPSIFYMTYDNDNIYFAARCLDSDTNKIKSSVSKRDNIGSDDWFAVVLDTFNDHQSGFGFIVNPLGIQVDGMMDNDANLNSDPDFIWFSKGLIDDKGYSVEMKIPLKSIRFPPGKKITMGLWLIRNINRNSENVCFPEIFADKGSILGQTQLISLSGLKYKRIVELLPAFTYSNQHHIDEGVLKADPKESEFSFTGKLGITQDLTLDATYKPDFSQVESDAGQVDVNLRYALYYSEKRPFFLEGSGAFAFAGNTEDAPLVSIVHTRRIIKPVMGFKLSGKLGKRTTITALYAKDDSTKKDTNDRADFTIFRFRHILKNDSYFGGFYTGRELLEGYNRIGGFDGRFRLSGLAMAEYHFIQSFNRDKDSLMTSNGHAAALRYNFSSRKVNMDIGIQDISRDFQTDVGFLNRSNITRVAIFGMYTFYPKSKFFQRIEPFYWSYHLLDKESKMVETMNLFVLRFKMPGNSIFRLEYYLGNEIFAKHRFNSNAAGFRFESQILKQLYLYMQVYHGNAIFYDPENPYPGKNTSITFQMNYQPFDKLNNSLSINYADFHRIPDKHKIYDYTIIRNRTTFQLNKYLLFRGIAEYNFFKKQIQMDFLASFIYIPGTVAYLGYGSVLEKSIWDPTIKDYIASNHFNEIRRGLFFKISYLWRL